MREGGSYTRNKGGKKTTLVERTKDHPEGNRPRDNDGNALNVAKPEQPKQKPAQAKE